jgi:hypothetical protein
VVLHAVEFGPRAVIAVMPAAHASSTSLWSSAHASAAKGDGRRAGEVTREIWM